MEFIASGILGMETVTQLSMLTQCEVFNLSTWHCSSWVHMTVISAAPSVSTGIRLLAERHDIDE